MTAMTPAYAAFLATCPAPLVPPDCDLRDFKYMPIYLDRLRKSETWINARYEPEIGFLSINLWFSSWHSVPAASMEASDTILAEAAMCDRRHWPEVREATMKGWVLCSDGRYYHPVVAVYALEAWAARTRYRKTMAKARDGKASKAATRKQMGLKLRGGSPPEKPSAIYQFHPHASDTPSDEPMHDAPWDEPAESPPPVEIVSPTPPAESAKPPKPQKSANSSIIDVKLEVRSRSRKREEEGSLRSPRTLRARECVSPDPSFDKFIAAYPIPQSPRMARMEWDAALARGADPADILAGLEQHRFADNPRFIKHPANWLAGECWRSPGVPREPFRSGALEVLYQSSLLRQAAQDDAPVMDGFALPGYMIPQFDAADLG